MEWTTIVTALIGAVFGGGGTFLFTRKETKESLTLDNVQKVLDAKDRIIAEREERCKELKGDLDKKDSKIEELYQINAQLRHNLDGANTRAAVAEVVRCDVTKCINRIPPFGSSLQVAE